MGLPNFLDWIFFFLERWKDLTSVWQMLMQKQQIIGSSACSLGIGCTNFNLLHSAPSHYWFRLWLRALLTGDLLTPAPDEGLVHVFAVVVLTKGHRNKRAPLLFQSPRDSNWAWWGAAVADQRECNSTVSLSWGAQSRWDCTLRAGEKNATRIQIPFLWNSGPSVVNED